MEGTTLGQPQPQIFKEKRKRFRSPSTSSDLSPRSHNSASDKPTQAKKKRKNKKKKVNKAQQLYKKKQADSLLLRRRKALMSIAMKMR